MCFKRNKEYSKSNILYKASNWNSQLQQFYQNREEHNRNRTSMVGFSPCNAYASPQTGFLPTITLKYKLFIFVSHISSDGCSGPTLQSEGEVRGSGWGPRSDGTFSPSLLPRVPLVAVEPFSVVSPHFPSISLLSSAIWFASCYLAV